MEGTTPLLGSASAKPELINNNLHDTEGNSECLQLGEVALQLWAISEILEAEVIAREVLGEAVFGAMMVLGVRDGTTSGGEHEGVVRRLPLSGLSLVDTRPGVGRHGHTWFVSESCV